MDGICSLHSVTTGSRDRANVVPLIIIIIIIIIKYDVYHNPIKQNPSFYAQYYPYKILLIYVSTTNDTDFFLHRHPSDPRPNVTN